MSISLSPEAENSTSKTTQPTSSDSSPSFTVDLKDTTKVEVKDGRKWYQMAMILKDSLTSAPLLAILLALIVISALLCGLVSEESEPLRVNSLICLIVSTGCTTAAVCFRSTSEPLLLTWATFLLIIITCLKFIVPLSHLQFLGVAIIFLAFPYIALAVTERNLFHACTCIFIILPTTFAFNLLQNEVSGLFAGFFLPLLYYFIYRLVAVYCSFNFSVNKVLIKPLLIGSCIMSVVGSILLSVGSSFELRHSTAFLVPIAGIWLVFVGSILVNCALQVRRFQYPDPSIKDCDVVGFFVGAAILLFMIALLLLEIEMLFPACHPATAMFFIIILFLYCSFVCLHNWIARKTLSFVYVLMVLLILSCMVLINHERGSEYINYDNTTNTTRFGLYCWHTIPEEQRNSTLLLPPSLSALTCYLLLGYVIMSALAKTDSNPAKIEPEQTEEDSVNSEITDDKLNELILENLRNTGLW